MINEFFLVFIPIFVAVDPLGVLPVFVSLTEGMTADHLKKVIIQSIVTAFALAAGFLILGKWILQFLGIAISDFMISGGIVLFCLALVDLVKTGRVEQHIHVDLGVVPIGTPLVVGPAVLTTSLMLADQYGIGLTLASIVLNLALVMLSFLLSDTIIRIFGKSGVKAVSRVMLLLLAAIAVMMIRKGIILTVHDAIASTI